MHALGRGLLDALLASGGGMPGREAGPLAGWLKEHPGARVICRDRAGGYANPRELHQTGVFALVAR